MKTIEAFKVICTQDGKKYVWRGDQFVLESFPGVTPKKYESRQEAEKVIDTLNKASDDWKRPRYALTIEPTTKEVYEYVITGKDLDGKRFKIHTRTPQCYNVWRGNVWELDQTGTKRTLVKSIYN